MDIILVILFTLALFLGMILILAAKPKFSGTITGTFIAIAAVGGLFFYGYAYAVTLDDPVLAVIRTLFNMCRMYVGVMDLGAISSVPLLQQPWAQLLFSLIHIMALFATASAAITTVGAEALRKLRLWLARWGQLNLVYGVNADTLDLGKQLLEKKGCTVVYVEEKPDATSLAAIAKAGCVLRSDDGALQANAKFVKTVGAHRKNRRITLYALGADAASCHQYAARLLETLEQFGIPAENTNLVIRGQESTSTIALQVLGEHYGYGAVTVVQEPGLAARILVREYAPCNTLSFDEDARAAENFEALIVGFGQVGQAVLRQLVMNGQFEGSTFRADVFCPDCDGIKGPFCRSFPQVVKNYPITFHTCDARSEELYDHLEQRGNKIKYLVVCTGSDRLNLEIGENLTEYFQLMSLNIPIYLCTRRGVKAMGSDGKVLKQHGLYDPRVLAMEQQDKMAMVINHHYQGDPDCPASVTWRRCDYFSRMSCRASADFLPAMLRMAGKTQQQVLEGDWTLTSVQLENMSKTEHLRWCAFHYCMGYDPMSEQEHAARCQAWQAQTEAGEKPLRITKNAAARTHACLTGWEELRTLSDRENAVTGGNRDYQLEDTKNIQVIPKLLRTAQQ